MVPFQAEFGSESTFDKKYWQSNPSTLRLANCAYGYGWGEKGVGKRERHAAIVYAGSNRKMYFATMQFHLFK